MEITFWKLSIYIIIMNYFWCVEKEMATHSSVPACRIPGTGQPGGLSSMGSHRVGHDWSDLAAAPAAFLMWDLSILLYVLLIYSIIYVIMNSWNFFFYILKHVISYLTVEFYFCSFFFFQLFPLGVLWLGSCVPRAYPHHYVNLCVCVCVSTYAFSSTTKCFSVSYTFPAPDWESAIF